VIQVGIITGDWLLDGHIELSTCTEPGCPDWHTSPSTGTVPKSSPSRSARTKTGN
jgi:hypothetical protein